MKKFGLFFLSAMMAGVLFTSCSEEEVVGPDLVQHESTAQLKSSTEASFVAKVTELFELYDSANSASGGELETQIESIHQLPKDEAIVALKNTGLLNVDKMLNLIDAAQRLEEALVAEQGNLYVSDLLGESFGSEDGFTLFGRPFWGRRGCETNIVGNIAGSGCVEQTICAHTYRFWIDFGPYVNEVPTDCPE